MTDRRAGDTSAERIDTVLILGGAGMVGLQVAREIARELAPKLIVLAAVREQEVREAIDFLADEIGRDRLAAEWGNIFVPEELRMAGREEIAAGSEAYDLLFDAVFRRESDYRHSALFKLVDKYKPGFRARLYQKDLRLANEAASANGVAMPATAIVSQLVNALVASGGADLDYAALGTVLFKLASGS